MESEQIWTSKNRMISIELVRKYDYENWLVQDFENGKSCGLEYKMLEKYLEDYYILDINLTNR